MEPQRVGGLRKAVMQRHGGCTQSHGFGRRVPTHTGAGNHHHNQIPKARPRQFLAKEYVGKMRTVLGRFAMGNCLLPLTMHDPLHSGTGQQPLGPCVLQRSHRWVLSRIVGSPSEQFTSAQNWAPQARRFRRSEQAGLRRKKREGCGHAEMTRVGRGVERG